MLERTHSVEPVHYYLKKANIWSEVVAFPIVAILVGGFGVWLLTAESDGTRELWQKAIIISIFFPISAVLLMQSVVAFYHLALIRSGLPHVSISTDKVEINEGYRTIVIQREHLQAAYTWSTKSKNSPIIHWAGFKTADGRVHKVVTSDLKVSSSEFAEDSRRILNLNIVDLGHSRYGPNL